MIKAFIKTEEDIFVPISIYPGGICVVEDEESYRKNTKACYDPRVFSYATLDNTPRVYSYSDTCCRIVMEICSRDENDNPVEMSEEEWSSCLKISLMRDTDKDD